MTTTQDLINYLSDAVSLYNKLENWALYDEYWDEFRASLLARIKRTADDCKTLFDYGALNKDDKK